MSAPKLTMILGGKDTQAENKEERRTMKLKIKKEGEITPSDTHVQRPILIGVLILGTMITVMIIISLKTLGI